MVKCLSCQTIHVQNTIFCSECGSYLLKDKDTETLSINNTSWLGDPINKPESGSNNEVDTETQVIRLKIDTNRRKIEMPLNRIIHLGRVAPAANIFPEIDLTDYTQAKNISRRHARILKRANAVVIEDLGSTNGTFINGQRLSPYKPEILNDGDTLQLGQMLIAVEILKMGQEA